MVQLLPVNGTPTPPTGIGLAAERPTIPDPPAVAELRDWSQESYDLTAQVAASLGFPVGQTTGSLSRRVLIFESSRSRDVEGDGHVYRFGVALRVVVEVVEAKGTGGLTLPVVAAKVELEGARATSRLSVRGYRGDDLGPLLPPWTSFGVDQYAGYMKAVSDMQAKIMANSAAIDPELLATSAAPSVDDQPPPAADAVAEVYALDAVAHRLPLAEALHRLPDLDDRVVAVIRDTYRRLVGGDDRTRPAEDHAGAAKEQLGGLRLRHGLFGF
jgi:hypothetical protein